MTTSVLFEVVLKLLNRRRRLSFQYHLVPVLSNSRFEYLLVADYSGEQAYQNRLLLVVGHLQFCFALIRHHKQER